MVPDLIWPVFNDYESATGLMALSGMKSTSYERKGCLILRFLSTYFLIITNQSSLTAHHIFGHMFLISADLTSNHQALSIQKACRVKSYGSSFLCILHDFGISCRRDASFSSKIRPYNTDPRTRIAHLPLGIIYRLLIPIIISLKSTTSWSIYYSCTSNSYCN